MFVPSRILLKVCACLILACSTFICLSYLRLTEWNHKPRVILRDNRTDDRGQITVTAVRDLPSKADDCGLWKLPGRLEATKTPQLVLDPDKLLYPGLVWGPNNQIVGLWQSVYLAIRLNRTLVVPVFYSHVTTGSGWISAFERIDVNRLCGFVSCISIEDMRKTCNKSFDVAFQAMPTSSKTLRQFESDTGMDILQLGGGNTGGIPGAVPFPVEENGVASGLPSLPGNSYTVSGGTWLKSDAKTLQTAYHTSARCAIYTSPFFTFGIGVKDGLATPLDASVYDVINMPDNVVYSAIVDAVRRPSCIADAASGYFRDVLNGGRFVAVHWRYDENDWGRKCILGNLAQSKRGMCEGVAKVRPVDVATAIHDSLLNDLKTMNDRLTDDLLVYVATPPSLYDFKENLHLELKKLSANFIRASANLTSYLEEHYQKCWISQDWSNSGEIYSLAEMEIMRLSEWFFHSVGSTWSSNVCPLRWERMTDGEVRRKFQASVLDLAVNAATKRLESLKLTIAT